MSCNAWLPKADPISGGSRKPATAPHVRSTRGVQVPVDHRAVSGGEGEAVRAGPLIDEGVVDLGVGPLQHPAEDCGEDERPQEHREQVHPADCSNVMLHCNSQSRRAVAQGRVSNPSRSASNAPASSSKRRLGIRRPARAGARPPTAPRAGGARPGRRACAAPDPASMLTSTPPAAARTRSGRRSRATPPTRARRAPRPARCGGTSGRGTR